MQTRIMVVIILYQHVVFLQVSIYQMNQGTYVFTLISTYPAPFVWLDVGNIAGRFSDNGFLLTEYKTVIYFFAKNPTTVTELEKTLHITTLRDIC